MPITSAALAKFVAEAKVNDGVRTAATTAILDTLAVLIAGSVEDATARIARTLARSDGQGLPSFDPRIALRPDDAALLYGTAAHALDFDDVSMLALCHPSAPVLAALLAAGPWAELTGPALCEAHAIGTEVTIRMGQAIGFNHYELGFHTTATMGVFGATAAVARLRGLDSPTTVNALAIAASLASGLRLNFGSMMKPIHVGIAAANAVRAVDWACAGVKADHGDLFRPGGAFSALSGGALVTWPEHVGLGTPFAVETPGLERKRFACCYLLHKLIALGIEASQRGARLDAIAKLRVEVPRGAMRPLVHPFPVSGTQAMFSAPYALIAAIHDGGVGFATFTDAAVARRVVKARLADVVVEEVAGPPMTPEEIGAGPVRLELVMDDGSIRRSERIAAPGSPADPMTADELETKWIDCFRRANPTLSAASAAALHSRGLCDLQSAGLEPWLRNVWAAARATAAPRVRLASA